MNLPTRKEWEEVGFTVPNSLCADKHSGQIIQVFMKTGKHAGKIIQVLDIKHVTERNGSTVKILMPGLEGTGTIVENPSAN